MNEVKSFTIYKEYYELITLLSEKEQQELLLAIFKYMFESEEPKLNDKQMKIFINLKRPLDVSKNNSKRSRGYGAPRGNQNASKKQTENNPENKPKTNQKQTEIKPEGQPKTNTSNDVDVYVNNYDNNYVVNVDVNVNNLYNYIETNFGRTLNPIEYEIVSKWEDNELTRYAIKEAVLNQAYNVKYVQAILDRLKAKGVKKLEDLEKPKREKQELVDYDWLNETD